jgi:hypothetical protein
VAIADDLHESALRLRCPGFRLGLRDSTLP